MNTPITTTFFILSLFLLPACNGNRQAVPESEGGFYYNGIYFGKHFSPSLKNGVEDGCTTSTGYYKKNHMLFNTDTDYNTGWFLGRSRCIPLLKIEENKK